MTAPDSAQPAAAEERSGPAASEDVRELLVLCHANAWLALPVDRIRAVVRMRPITPVPRAPERVRGVISLRGEVLQVLDLHRCLPAPDDEAQGESAAPLRDRRRIVVIEAAEGGSAGLLVDRVVEVCRVPESQLRVPDDAESGPIEALASHGGRFVSILDVDRLLESDGGR